MSNSPTVWEVASSVAVGCSFSAEGSCWRSMPASFPVGMRSGSLHTAVFQAVGGNQVLDGKGHFRNAHPGQMGYPLADVLLDLAGDAA